MTSNKTVVNIPLNRVEGDLELKLAIQECGRKLGIHVRKQKRIRDEMVKRSYIETYLPHIGEALKEILVLKEPQVDELVDNLTTILEKTRSMP